MNWLKSSFVSWTVTSFPSWLHQGYRVEQVASSFGLMAKTTSLLSLIILVQVMITHSSANAGMNYLSQQSSSLRCLKPT